MSRVLLSILALGLLSLACVKGTPTPRPSLFPSPTIEVTQTPVIVQVTQQVFVEITNTPEPTKTTPQYCVSALVAVHLRPSASDDNYPIVQLLNGAKVTDLGGRDGAWWFVEAQEKQGWVNSSYLGEC